MLYSDKMNTVSNIGASTIDKINTLYANYTALDNKPFGLPQVGAAIVHQPFSSP